MAIQRLSNVENFSFRRSSTSEFVFNWEKDGRKYHVWYYETKGLADEIHSNNMDPTVRTYSPQGHKRLDMLAKKWQPMREDLLAYLTPSNLAEATRAFEEAARQRFATRQNENYEKAVSQVNKLIDSGDFDGTPTRNVFCALLTLPRDHLLRLI